MTEKVEWEVVEEPGARAGDGEARQAGARPAAGVTPEALLGRWWRWKLAGILALGAIVLVLFVALAGVVAVALATAVLVSLGAARLAKWLRGNRGGALARRGYGPPQ